MKANELRIGNWVLDSGELTQVWSIALINETWQINGSSYIHVIEPIEINEEWLIRFGFKKKGIEWQGDIILEDHVGLHYSGGEGVRLSVDIKYVHQLQNLSFSIEGQELIISQ